MAPQLYINFAFSSINILEISQLLELVGREQLNVYCYILSIHERLKPGIGLQNITVDSLS